MKMPPNGGAGAVSSSSSAAATVVAAPASNPEEGTVEKKNINSELWQACAGPLVNLPAAGTHVIYFPQGHSEQVAASMKKDVDGQIPNYPNLPSKLLCLLHNITLHADPETDEVYAQMTLQPVTSFDKDILLRSDLSLKTNKPQPDFFCKSLTASDTSTHGGFSVPRRAAEKIFPSLDFSMTPPAQELMARDLHDNVWTFRHIYRGQPKRHLLTTGWSLFVSGKRLFAGDSVLFIRDEKQQLLLGIRRANRQPTNLSSSVLSSDSMHIGILAAAAHAAANNSPFTVFYNPRTSPTEFVIPLAKYYKAVYGNQLSLGMRFRMMFETEESGTRRYMGTITGISDLDPVRWKNSQWRNLQVGWDESTTGERRSRVSIWEIEPVTAPFFICPPPFFRSKRPRQPGIPDDEASDLDHVFKRNMPWLGDDMCMRDTQAMPGLSLVQWMNMQQNPSMCNSGQPNYMHPLSGSVVQNLAGPDLSRQLGFSTQQIPPQTNLQFNAHTLPSNLNPMQPQNSITQTQPLNQVQTQTVSPQIIQQQQQLAAQNHQLTRNVPQNLQSHQQQQRNSMGQNEQHNITQSQLPDQVNPHLQMSENQIQLQLLHKLQQQQQQALLAQQSMMQQQQQPQIQLLDSSNRMLEMPQTTKVNNNITQQVTTKSNNQTTPRFSHPLHQQNLQHQVTGMPPELTGHGGLIPPSITTGNALGAGQSIITDDVPSCSTSPSTNNCSNMGQPMINSRANRSTPMRDSMPFSASMLINPNALENMSSNTNMVKDFQQSTDVKPSLDISKTQNQTFLAPQTYMNGTDYLDTSSSTNSVCFPQSDVHLHQTSLSYNPQSILTRDASQDRELQADPRSNVPYGNHVHVHGQLGTINPDPLLMKGIVGLEKDFSNSHTSGGMLANFENTKEVQQELSSSIVSQSFGVPDMTFNSIDSTINDSGFLDQNTWAPPPQSQFQRIRTYTKVYKRGAVGRSIDITRYSGYHELKQDLARRFGIEGQLEDRGRIGWKLVYVDHENDVLLVGDDPWEEFVTCVRCIKILSPQEVQQMSLDGDFGGSIPSNQACSSSDNRNC